MNKNKILIIDSMEELREGNVALFEKNNFEVLSAADGIEGLSVLNNEPMIDLVLTAINMPRMSGFDLIKSMRESAELKNIPVVVFAHLGEEGSREAMIDLRVSGFMVQGLISPDRMVEEVKIILKQGSYFLKIDPYELDAQNLIDDYNLPVKLECRNCNANLAIKVSFSPDRSLTGKIVCPECQLEYLSPKSQGRTN